MVQKEEIEIPPMPDDWMPPKTTCGQPIRFNDEYHRVCRDQQRIAHWKKKWKIHYLEQLLTQRDHAGQRHGPVENEKYENEKETGHS